MSPSTTLELQPGERLAERYRVVEHIGSGGMGAVYRVHDLETREELALKLLTVAVTDGMAVVRFKREFRSASRLSHPSCVRVHDLVQDGARWFFTMELVPGRAFGIRDEGPSDPRYVVGVALQALAALDHIHAQQIVHRDIKPQNMLVTEPAAGPPELKLTDFGISKLGDMDEQESVGSLMGSLPYMAPEQVAESRVDPRSDLYSLGVVLYLALGGVHPLTPPGHTGRLRPSVSEWCRMKLTGDARPLYAVAPQLPLALVEIIDAMLARDPSARPATAAIVYDALVELVERVLGPVPVPELPPLSRASYLAAPTLVGRETEVEQLERFLARSLGESSTGGGLLAIAGEAGMGKSKLVAQLPGLVRGLGGQLFTGTCRAEGGAAYEPVRHFLSAAGRKARADEASEADRSRTGMRMSSSASSASSQGPSTEGPTALVPTAAPTVARDGGHTLARIPGPAAEEPRAGAEGTQAQANKLWQFQREIADGLRGLAEDQPCVVLVEDVHWADAAPLELLMFLLRTAHAVTATGTPVRWAVVITHRPSPCPAALGWLREVARELQTYHELLVEPLGYQATADLVASMLMRPHDEALERFVERLVKSVGRKPLDLTQALYLLVAHHKLERSGTDWDLDRADLEDADVQRRVQSAIGDRAARFSVETKRALAAAAVIGRSSELAALQRLTGVDEALLLDCLDEAIRASFLEETAAGTYMFVHSRFRDAILAELPEDVLRGLHGRAADHLIRDRGGDDPTAIAYHCARALRWREAYRHGRVAARAALSDHAFSRAAALYEDVLRYREAAGGTASARLVERFGTACLQAGRYDDASAAFARCLEQKEAPLDRAELLRKSAEVEFRRPDMERARERLQQLLSTLRFSVPQSSSSVGMGIVRQGSAMLMGWMHTPGLVDDQDQRRRYAMISSACAALGEAYYFSDFNRAVYYQAASVNAAERLGPSPELAIAAAQQGYILSSFGYYERGLAYLDRAREAALTAATPVEGAWEAVMRAMSHHCQGDPASAVLHTSRAEALLRRSAEPLRVRQAWTIHGEALACLGRYEQVLRIAHELERLALELDDRRALGWARYISGHARWRSGDTEGGLEDLRQGARLNAQAGDLANGSAATARWVLALVLGGHVDEALEEGRSGVRTLMDKKLRNPASTMHGVFLTAAAAAVARSPERLDRALRKDVRRTIAAGRRYCAQILFTKPAYLAGLAAWEHVQGNVDGARSRLDEAAAFADEHGMVGELADVEAIRGLCEGFGAS